MVGYLVRLRLRLAWRNLTTSTGRIIASAVALLYALGLLGGLGAGAVALGADGAALARGPILTLAMAAVTLAWPFLALFGAGADPLDPTRFALTPRRGRELVPGLLVAGLLGPGAIIVGVLGALVAVAWRSEPLPLLMGVLQLVPGVVLCALMVRLTVTGLGAVLGRRRVRETLGVLLLLGILGAGVLLQALPDEVMRHLSDPRPPAWLVTAAQAARWTPFGWCWSLPWDAQQGAWAPLAVHLVASLALIAVLARCWTGLVERALVNPGTRSVEAVRIRGSRLDALLPGGPMGALMGRELRYWRRDSRRVAQLLGIVAVPVVMLVPALTEGRTELLLGAPFLCAVMTATVSAWGLSHDGSALWILALAQVSAGRERAARVAVVALLTGPLLAANLVVTLALSPGLDVPGLLGMTVGPWLVALGTGTWVDSMWQQSLPPPAAGLSVRSTGSSVEGLVGSLLSMAVPVIGALPPIVLFALASMGARGLGWAGLAVGLLIGALACWGGIRLAGRRLERTWPEILVRVAERTA